MNIKSMLIQYNREGMSKLSSGVGGAFGVTDKNCNFSAVRSPIELKLSGERGLVSQISVHVLVSRFNCFSFCKQTKEPKNT
jgi:hypothetical protein